MIVTPSLYYMAEVASAAGFESYGVVYGVYNMAWAVGLMISPALGGFLLERVGLAALTIGWSAFLLATSVILARLQSRRLRRVRVAIRSISFHSASDTGMTESRGSRVSTNVAKALEALISARVTGRSRARTGAISTTRSLAGLVLGIWVGITHRAGHADDGLFVAGVVIEDAVTLLDAAEVLLRQRILDARPGRAAVFRKLFEAVARRFFFEEPIHVH